MASYGDQVIVPLEAAADLSALQYTAAYVDSDGKAAAATANTHKVIGWIQNKPLAGEIAEIAVSGRTKAVAGEAIDHGVLCTVSTGGKLDAVDAAGDWCSCMTLTEATADGDIVEVLIMHVGFDAD